VLLSADIMGYAPSVVKWRPIRDHSTYRLPATLEVRQTLLGLIDLFLLIWGLVMSGLVVCPQQHDDLVAVGVAEDAQEYLLWIRLCAARRRLMSECADLMLIVPDPELEHPSPRGTPQNDPQTLGPSCSKRGTGAGYEGKSG
jgi:hypothetical protein